MAEHIEVELKVETDADRRLKEWEERRDGCPLWANRRKTYHGDACPHFYFLSLEERMQMVCNKNICPYVHWGWR